MNTTQTCAHHWIIAPAQGPTSSGTCQICHEGREFQNSSDSNAVWGNTDPVVIKTRYRGNLKLARREP